MPALDDAGQTIRAARAELTDQLNGVPAGSSAEQALLQHLDRLSDTLQAVEIADLEHAAGQVAAAVQGLQAVIDDARLDTLSQLKQRLRSLRDDLDGHHDTLFAATKLARAAAPESPAAAPTRPTAAASGDTTIVPINSTSFAVLRAEYQKLYDTCTVVPGKEPLVKQELGRLMVGRPRYTAVAADTPGMPWWLVGIIHGMEAGYSFARHQHNGDPLTARTVQVPAGRPATGMPPFTWEQSARDALAFEKLTVEIDFSIPHCLYYFEKFNGFGYRGHGVPTPYLWGFSTHYKSGKFVADHVFDAGKVSAQVGAALLVQELERQGALN